MSKSSTTPNERGLLNILTIPNPGAGVEIDFPLPAGFDYLVEAVYFMFTASVAVANRKPMLRIRSAAGDNLHEIRDLGVVTALAGVTYSFALGAGVNGTGGERTYSLPVMDLAAGCRLMTSTAALDAGDTYTLGRVVVRQWIAA